MNNFKDKISMFESVMKPPPVKPKPKPAFKSPDSNVKHQSEPINANPVKVLFNDLSLLNELKNKMKPKDDVTISMEIFEETKTGKDESPSAMEKFEETKTGKYESPSAMEKFEETKTGKDESPSAMEKSEETKTGKYEPTSVIERFEKTKQGNDEHPSATERLEETKPGKDQPPSVEITVCEYSDDVVGYYEPIEAEECKNLDREPIEDDHPSKNLTFEFRNSEYDLPGLENFDFKSEKINVASNGDKSVPSTSEFQIELYHESSDEDEQCDARVESILMTETELEPSQGLVEEIAYTNNLRDSSSFSDDVISISMFSTTSSTNQDSVRQSILSEEAFKNQAQSKRSFLSNIFHRKPKNITDKEMVKEKVSQKGSTNKEDANTKNNYSEDNNVAERSSKKPLNALLNRDWLNSIGDGVMKKATVMSELKKVFYRGKLTGPQQKSSKQNIDGKMEKPQKKACGYEEYKGNSVADLDDKMKKLKAQNSKSQKSIINCEMKNNNLKTSVPNPGPNDKKNVFVLAVNHEQENDSDPDLIYDDEFDDDDSQENSKPEKIDAVANVVGLDETKVCESTDDIVYDDADEMDEEVLDDKVCCRDEGGRQQDSMSRLTGTYDDDGNIVEVYEMEEVDVVCVKSDRNKGHNKSSMRDTETYDEDPEMVEEYASDADDSSSKKDIRGPQNGVKKLPNSKEEIECKKKVWSIKGDKKEASKFLNEFTIGSFFKKKEKKVVVVDNPSELYEDDACVEEEYASDESVYDNYEEYDEDDDGLDKDGVGDSKKNVNSKERLELEEEYDCDEGSERVVDLEVYEEDNISESSSVRTEKKSTKDREIPKKKKPTNDEDSKKSFTCKLKKEMIRRGHNIILNLKVLEPARIDVIEKKNSDTKVPEPVINDLEKAEDEALRKLIKKNLDCAKKIFKLKEPIMAIAEARALKTSFVESKLYLQFNIGELLDVLEVRDNLLLVKNAVGKCGLTSKINVQIIENAP